MKIEIKNLSFRAGNKEILKDVSACFEGRQIYGIIGPNGSGKTTLLKHIYRQLPSAGAVFADGQEIGRIPHREYAKKVAVMMQHQDLYESDLRVFETVLSGRYPYKKVLSGYDGEDEAIVNRILQENDLYACRDRKLSTLSGGELQRVMICRCFAQQPEAILLDEPTNHLDIRFKLELMKTLKAFPGLVIMTLHDLNLAARFCRKLLVLKDGRIFTQGTPDEVFKKEVLREVFQADIEVQASGGKIYVGV